MVGSFFQSNMENKDYLKWFTVRLENSTYSFWTNNNLMYFIF